jgi:hypothetical protein
MSKVAPAVCSAPRSRLILNWRMNKMDNVEQIKKSFRESRIAGEKLLEQGKITWEQFSFTMIGFELKLKVMGVNL